MFIKHFDQVAEEIPTLEGTKGCTVRWLIGQKDGAKNYAMRLFELQPGGLIPLHSHEETEHEIFIINGEGTINDGENDIRVKKDDVIFVKPGEKHSFINNSQNPLKFICIIPILK
jgi:quercetin dioxygenase-like cupin family protein